MRSIDNHTAYGFSLGMTTKIPKKNPAKSGAGISVGQVYPWKVASQQSLRPFQHGRLNLIFFQHYVPLTN